MKGRKIELGRNSISPVGEENISTDRRLSKKLRETFTKSFEFYQLRPLTKASEN
jgi:hypothetical protein